jgi:hypothetical protein
MSYEFVWYVYDNEIGWNSYEKWTSKKYDDLNKCLIDAEKFNPSRVWRAYLPRGFIIKNDKYYVQYPKGHTIIDSVGEKCINSDNFSLDTIDLTEVDNLDKLKMTNVNDTKTEFGQLTMNLVFDLETIDLPRGNRQDYKNLKAFNSARVVQLGAILCDNAFNVIDTLCMIVKRDGFAINNSECHGITNTISDTVGVSIVDILTKFKLILSKCTHIYAHNALNFDIPVIKSEAFRANMHDIIDIIETKTIVDTMIEYRPLVDARTSKGTRKSPSFVELYKYCFPVEIYVQKHNADDDTKDLLKILKHLHINTPIQSVTTVNEIVVKPVQSKPVTNSTPDLIMKFGKYKDKKVIDLPHGYLGFILRSDGAMQPYKDYILSNFSPTLIKIIKGSPMEDLISDDDFQFIKKTYLKFDMILEERNLNIPASTIDIIKKMYVINPKLTDTFIKTCIRHSKNPNYRDEECERILVYLRELDCVISMADTLINTCDTCIFDTDNISGLCNDCSQELNTEVIKLIDRCRETEFKTKGRGRGFWKDDKNKMEGELVEYRTFLSLGLPKDVYSKMCDDAIKILAIAVYHNIEDTIYDRFDVTKIKPIMDILSSAGSSLIKDIKQCMISEFSYYNSLLIDKMYDIKIGENCSTVKQIDMIGYNGNSASLYKNLELEHQELAVNHSILQLLLHSGYIESDRIVVFDITHNKKICISIKDFAKSDRNHLISIIHAFF